MLILLPPSETKVAGGEPGTTLDISRLSFSSQNTLRESLLQQVALLSLDEEAALAALKLGPKGASEVQRNREILSSPVMPALYRYTGVLFDALDVTSLDARAEAWVRDSVAIFSALFGVILATDPIPAYRLSFDSSLSGGPLAKQWATCASELWREVPGFVLDLRSEGYRKLAPLPEGKGIFVALVTAGPGGVRKAVGHANKSVKGRLVRALAESGATLGSLSDVLDWGHEHGYTFESSSSSDGVMDLVVSGS